MAKQNIFPNIDKKEHFNLVIYDKSGRHFELDVDPDNAINYKDKKKVDLMTDVLKAKHIYSDVRKGMLASKDDLMAVFNTLDVEVIAKKILSDGKLQLSENYRKQKNEALFKKIITDIHRISIDARTELPLPLTRIENGLIESKFKFKENVAYEKQLKEAIDALKKLMPIRIANIKYSILFDLKFSDHIVNYIENIGTILKKSSSGSNLTVLVEIPSGLKQEFIDALNSFTHGTAKIELIK